MRSIWQSLAWKEWHEHKWKLAALTGVLGGVTAFVVIALIKEQDYTLDAFLPVLVMGVIPLTIFVASGEAASENAQRTMPFLQALPVPMWKAAAWKLVFGAVTCLLPVLFVLLLVPVWYFCVEAWGEYSHTAVRFEELELQRFVGTDHPLLDWIVVSLIMAGAVVVSFLLWTSAIGAGRKSEVAAGALALVVMIAWWAGIFVLVNLLHTRSSPELQGKALITFLLAAGPGGLPLLLLNMAPRWPWLLWIVLPVAVAIHSALALWFVFRFGRVGGVGEFSPQTATADPGRRDWLGPPRSSPLSAIAWKQFRESGPIVLAGLAAILAFVVVNILTYAGTEELASGYDVAFMILGLTANIGFLVVLIAGIGVFDRDLSPKFHTFWRSRPINPDLWYWTKYVTGLIVLSGALLIPVAIAGGLSSFRLSNPPEQPSPLTVLMLVVCVYWAIYALAAATICLIRVTIYAAILSAGALAFGTGALWLCLDNMEMELSELLATASIMAITVAVLATLVGWWAVRRDIAWKK